MSPQHRFSGPELGALLERVRQELGAEAQIHEANKVRSGGVAGFFANESFEVIASADGQVPGDTPPPPAARAERRSEPRARSRAESRAGSRPESRAEPRDPAPRDPAPRDAAPQIIETAARSNHRPAGVAAGLLDRAEEISVTERITGQSGRPGQVDLRATPAPRFDQVLAAEVNDSGVDLDFRVDSGAPTPSTPRSAPQSAPQTAPRPAPRPRVPSVDLTNESAAPPPPAAAPTITIPATDTATTNTATTNTASPTTPAPPSPSAARFWTALSSVENQLSADDPDRRCVFMGSLDAAMAAAHTMDVTATVLTPSTPPSNEAPWMCFSDPAEISARLMWHDSQQHGETPAPIVIDLALADRVNTSLDRIRSHGPVTVHLAVTENLSVKEILNRFSTIGGKVVLDIVHEAPPAYVMGLIDHGIRIASVGGRRFDAGLALALRQSMGQSVAPSVSQPMRAPAPTRG